MRSLLLAMVMCLAAAGEPVRVMTFNVRYPNPQDGADYWERRKETAAAMVSYHAPDVMGTQELFKVQGDDLVAQLKNYAWFGTSRRGNDQDEHMGLFYRKDKLAREEWGQFWLSERPDEAGSESWGVTLPRMVTWGLFRMKNGKRFYVLNTHFAHRREDEEARKKSAEVIRERMKGLKKGIPVVVTGDFNAPAGGEVHGVMLGEDLRDTRAAAGLVAGPEGTFHGFRGLAGNARIDWVLVSKEWEVRRNETVTDSGKGRWPSDHFPVLAELELK